MRSAVVFSIVLFAMSTLSVASKVHASDSMTGMDWYTQGRQLQDAGDYDAAIEAFQHAADMNFQPAGAFMRMAQIAGLRGNTASALDLLKKAYAQNPMAVSLLPQLGGIPALADNAEFIALMSQADETRHPCKTRPEASQFDFWLGEWKVTNPQGQLAGENSITSDLHHCVVRESWTNVYGDHGTSVNFFDPASAQWHQVWTSDNGTITHYVGNFLDGAMRFKASGFGDTDGKTAFRRMTFTPNPDGSVRQLIEDSTDGNSWVISFDGIYRRTDAVQPEH